MRVLCEGCDKSGMYLERGTNDNCFACLEKSHEYLNSLIDSSKEFVITPKCNDVVLDD